MVREIIHVQVGQCGNQIGNAFWNTMAKEHNLSENGKFKGKPDEKGNQARLDKIDVYYQEAGTMRFVPRACLVDLEPGIMDVIKASPMGPLFKPDNMTFGASGAGNNWYVDIDSKKTTFRLILFCRQYIFSVNVWSQGDKLTIQNYNIYYYYLGLKDIIQKVQN